MIFLYCIITIAKTSNIKKLNNVISILSQLPVTLLVMSVSFFLAHPMAILLCVDSYAITYLKECSSIALRLERIIWCCFTVVSIMVDWSYNHNIVLESVSGANLADASVIVRFRISDVSVSFKNSDDCCIAMLGLVMVLS